MAGKCDAILFFHVHPKTLSSESRIVPQHQLLHLSVLWQRPRACAGNERAKEQAPWVQAGSRGGQGPSNGGQRIHGPETHTKKGINFKFHWQKSLSVPSWLIKVACDLEPLLSTGTLPGEGGGRRVWRLGGGGVSKSLFNQDNFNIYCYLFQDKGRQNVCIFLKNVAR